MQCNVPSNTLRLARLTRHALGAAMRAAHDEFLCVTEVVSTSSRQIVVGGAQGDGDFIFSFDCGCRSSCSDDEDQHRQTHKQLKRCRTDGDGDEDGEAIQVGNEHIGCTKQEKNKHSLHRQRRGGIAPRVLHQCFNLDAPTYSLGVCS